MDNYTSFTPLLLDQCPRPLANFENSTVQFRQRKSSGTSEVQSNIKGNARMSLLAFVIHS